MSTKTPIIATQPWSRGFSTFASAWACGVEPKPASLEKSPRLAPCETAIFSAVPNPPPIIACGANAYLKIIAKVAGRYCARSNKTKIAPAKKITAMTGTSFSVTDAKRWTPPRKMNPQRITKIIPTSHDGTLNAVSKDSAIEFD